MTRKIKFTMLPAAVLLANSAFGADMTLTQNDLNAMKYKVDMAAKFFESTWRGMFAKAGKSYPAPRLVAFRFRAVTGCGTYEGKYAKNALFCGADNAIYYNVDFLTEEMKIAAAAKGTDGDYAPIVILAHEMGHGVATMLDANSKFALTYSRERLADCLAGVVTSSAQRAGNLERGDLEEGLFALGRGGDHPSISILHPKAHGPAEARRSAFLLGYNSGIQACDAGVAKSLAVSAPVTKPWERPSSFPRSPFSK